MKDSLLKIKKDIQSCKKCRLYKSAKRAVAGEGPVNAKLFFIGIAPGREEDKSGRPFVGRAGKFLDDLLKLANTDRKKVFITSVVKHFPPKNRKPKSDEINACLPFLQRQVGLIKPKLVVLLGEVPVKTLLNENIKNVCGKIIKKENRVYFVTYHPAAGMRFPKIRKIMKRDFRKLGSILK